jgi:hypothetical protein
MDKGRASPIVNQSGRDSFWNMPSPGKTMVPHALELAGAMRRFIGDDDKAVRVKTLLYLDSRRVYVLPKS